mgnify:CR=1 FL=1
MSGQFKSIAVAKEIESPENPGGLERRVALVPDDVKRLVVSGFDVYVEYGAGEGVEFSDDAYMRAGAKLQSHEDIYRDKDLVIKFKGLALDTIPRLTPGTTVMCFAYSQSYPERDRMLEQNQINVIAMEEILESPKQQNDEEILGRLAMSSALQAYLDNNEIGGLQVKVIGWSKVLAAAIRRASNRDPRSVEVINPSSGFEAYQSVGANVLYFYDSDIFSDTYGHLSRVSSMDAHVVDVRAVERFKVQELISEYRQTHPPFEFGMRRIQCLHETGQAGARYGLKVLQENKPDLALKDARAVVLGYGNVAQGAIDELVAAGLMKVDVLGSTHTVTDRIDYWIKQADIIINGVNLDKQLRGKNYLITNEHVRNVIPKGSVIIDLVGGSENNRSPIEPVTTGTFLDNPHFVQDGITIAALWGWPMMGMMRESAVKYSSQILDVLMGPEKLLEGLEHLTPGVERALVCGPFTRGVMH